MDHQRNVGIVLRHFGRYITIFDRTHRRRDVITYRVPVSRGAFISYILTQDKGQQIAIDVQLEYMPLAQARLDIYFLHSLLEMCYYFIPEGGIEVPIYSFLLKILRSFELLTSGGAQKSVLCIFFAHLGIYPPEAQLCGFVEVFLNTPIDNVVQGNLELAHEDFLNKWLIWCVNMYPQGKKCKSLPLFLQKR